MRSDEEEYEKGRDRFVDLLSSNRIEVDKHLLWTAGTGLLFAVKEGDGSWCSVAAAWCFGLAAVFSASSTETAERMILIELGKGIGASHANWADKATAVLNWAARALLIAGIILLATWASLKGQSHGEQQHSILPPSCVCGEQSGPAMDVCQQGMDRERG